MKRLLLEGGGGTNGAFLRAGLVDEFNLVLCPAVDGAKGAPSVFDSTEAEADQRAPITAMTLESSQALEGGAMLLRYRIENALSKATLVGKGQHGSTASRAHRRHWGRSRGPDRSARARAGGQKGDDTGSTGKEMRRPDPSASVHGVRIPGGRRSRIRPWRGGL